MKLLIMLALVVLISPISFRAQEKVKKTEDTIREIDSKLMAAQQQGDAATLDTLLADDYIEINAQGIVRHKTDIMASVRSRASVPPSQSIGPEITVDETTLRVFGDTAILTSRINTRYQFMENQTVPQPSASPAQTPTSQVRSTKVFSKLNGRWQIVASQATAIASH